MASGSYLSSSTQLSPSSFDVVDGLARLMLYRQGSDTDNESVESETVVGVNGVTLLSIAGAQPPTRYFETHRCKGYEPQQTTPIMKEFTRLASIKGWKKQSPEYIKEKERCILMEFGYFSQDDKPKLARLQSLCKDLGITKIPASMKQGKQCLNSVYVNIYSYINCKRREGKDAKVQPIFRDREQFRAYTSKKDRMCPKWIAKNDEILRMLLKEVF